MTSLASSDGLGRNGTLDGIAPLGSPTMRTIKFSDRVAQVLARHIIDRGIPEGTRLPAEREMLELLGVGRSTLREALRLLETRGVLTIRAGRFGGPVVRRPRSSDLGEALALKLEFDGATLSDVFDAHLALEPRVCRLAARHATPEQIARMDQTVTDMRRDERDDWQFRDLNIEFHAIVAEAASSSVLQTIMASLQAIADRAFIGVDRADQRRSAVIEAHERIARAIARSDEDGAEEAMRDHIAEACQFMAVNYPKRFGGRIRWAEADRGVGIHD